MKKLLVCLAIAFTSIYFAKAMAVSGENLCNNDNNSVCIANYSNAEFKATLQSVQPASCRNLVKLSSGMLGPNSIIKIQHGGSTGGSCQNETSSVLLQPTSATGGVSAMFVQSAIIYDGSSNTYYIHVSQAQAAGVNLKIYPRPGSVIKKINGQEYAAWKNGGGYNFDIYAK